MPWRASTVMEERLRFVARRLEGESMTALCRQSASHARPATSSARCKAHGLEAIADRPRRARAGCEPAADAGRGGDRRVQARASDLGRAQAARAAAAPARSRSCLCRRARRSTRCSTATGWSNMRVPVARGRRARRSRRPTPPNDLWCCDFKGEFRLGDGRLCYPLTVTDQASRYLLLVEALEGTAEPPVFTAFHRLFQEAACRVPSARDNESRKPPSPAAASTASPGSRSGGCVSASLLEPITPGARSRTAATSACTSPSSRKPPGPPPPPSSPSRPVSTPSSPRSTPSARTRRWPQDPRRSSAPLVATLRRTCPAAYPFHDRDLFVARNGTIGLHGRQRHHLPPSSRDSARPPQPRHRRLPRQLHALRSRIHRPGGTKPTNYRHPVQLKDVTHVIGTRQSPHGPELAAKPAS